MAKKRITFTFDESTIKDLKEISNKTEVPQARIVERLIKEYVRGCKKRGQITE